LADAEHFTSSFVLRKRAFAVKILAENRSDIGFVRVTAAVKAVVVGAAQSAQRKHAEKGRAGGLTRLGGLGIGRRGREEGHKKRSLHFESLLNERRSGVVSKSE
jgi:hypothetical protein